MPNQRAIMSVVNKKYIDPLKVMWTSLFSSNEYPMDFYLFYEDLSEAETADLVSFVSRWVNVNLVLMPVSSEMLEGLPVQMCSDIITGWQDILNLLFHDSYVELPWSGYNCPPLQYIMDKEITEAGIFRVL